MEVLPVGGGVVVDEEPVEPPPPHPANDNEIEATSASSRTFRFLLISFKVSKANATFDFITSPEPGTAYGHCADAVSTAVVLSRVR